MKLKFFLILALSAFLLCSLSAHAQPPEKCLFFRVLWEEDGTYKISELRAVMDFPLAIDENGNFLIKIADGKGTTLYQHKTKKFSMALVPSIESQGNETMQINEIIIDQDELVGAKKGQMFFLLPYLEEAKTLSFEHGTKVLAKADLSALCSNNGKCEEPENFVSCPQDCALDKEDGYCYAYKDGVCDPDCAEGIDPDCAGETPEPIPEPEKDSIILPAIALGFAAIILFILLRKRAKSKNCP